MFIGIRRVLFGGHTVDDILNLDHVVRFSRYTLCADGKVRMGAILTTGEVIELDMTKESIGMSILEAERRAVRGV
ncbi:MAG TPA: hypothetical protein VGU20_14025 [Stellaceae bacterium]|nr:hypothetical protein [Stellaceae bacterium]